MTRLVDYISGTFMSMQVDTGHSGKPTVYLTVESRSLRTGKVRTQSIAVENVDEVFAPVMAWAAERRRILGIMEKGCSCGC